MAGLAGMYGRSWRAPEEATPETADLLRRLSWLREELERLEEEIDDDKTKKKLRGLAQLADPRRDPPLARRATTWTFRRVPRTANRILRSHWHTRRRDRENWRRHVQVVAGRPPRTVRGKVFLEILVYRHTRQDPDNAYASVKNLLDALVSEGWLEDDSPDHIELRVTERVERKRKKRRTEVTWITLDAEMSDEPMMSLGPH